MKKKIKKNWCKLPYLLIEDKNLMPIDAIIYSIMLDKSYPDLSVKISHEKLTKITGTSISTIKRAIERLEKNGYLWKVTTSDEGKELIYKLFEIIPRKNNKEDENNEQEDIHVNRGKEPMEQGTL